MKQLVKKLFEASQKDVTALPEVMVSDSNISAKTILVEVRSLAVFCNFRSSQS